VTLSPPDGELGAIQKSLDETLHNAVHVLDQEVQDRIKCVVQGLVPSDCLSTTLTAGLRRAVALAPSDARRFAQEQQRWLDEQRTRMQQDRLLLWQSIVAVHKQRYGSGGKRSCCGCREANPRR